MEETLSRLLKKEIENNKIGQFTHPIGAPLFSHLLYVDELLVFYNGQKRLMKRILGTLEKYGSWSCQAITKEKSALFMSK